VALALTLALVACTSEEERRHKNSLDSLVAHRGTRADVERELGSGYVLYAKGQPTWNDLEKFLAHEPASALPRVREAAAQYPKIMFYTTAWRMTWVFLDDKEIVQGYALSAQ
jgi:hypothetical protein